MVNQPTNQSSCMQFDSFDELTETLVSLRAGPTQRTYSPLARDAPLPRRAGAAEHRTLAPRLRAPAQSLAWSCWSVGNTFRQGLLFVLSASGKLIYVTSVGPVIFGILNCCGWQCRVVVEPGRHVRWARSLKSGHAFKVCRNPRPWEPSVT